MRNQSHTRNLFFHCALIVSAGVATALAPAGKAQALTFRTLHSFCKTANCGDGETPRDGLVMDAPGNLYGTTEDGGKYGFGVAFKLVPNATKTKYTEHILKSFCADAGCPDGKTPQGELIMDVDGALYGAAASGGKFGGGVIFKLKPVTDGWQISVVHSFCANTNCTDGAEPITGLAYAGQASGAPWDKSSPLFGTTYLGGTRDKGTAYQLSPNGSGWTYKVLHSFDSPNTSANPRPLLVDLSGNLFGVTNIGGMYGYGSLYRLAAGTWNESVLHNFCAEPNCTDGAYGEGRLVMDAAGNLFGVALEGGTYGLGFGGVVFERPAGGGYQVIYNFCGDACRDGEFPEAGLVMDAGGNLFGTTGFGGKDDNGTVYKLSFDSGTQQWTESVLVLFCHKHACTRGRVPYAPLTLDANGNLFGTNSAGGANGNGGTVFELTP